MANSLTASSIERQNILNNPYALSEIEKNIGITGFQYQGITVLLKEQVASFYEVTPRTIDNLLSANKEELDANGYQVFRGKKLKAFKEFLNEFGNEIDFVTKTTQLGVFNIRTFLNIGMLLTDSERAKLLRTTVLDIVIDTINKKTGGGTKYINQRDEDFVHASFIEENYQKEFTNALRDYVDLSKFKYATYTDKIYKSIFRENSKEYRKVLKLQIKDKVRDTFYSEILDLIASYEFGFAKLLEETFKQKNRKLTFHEVDKLFLQFEQMPLWQPLIERARVKMASRDLAFQDALHKQLSEYITPVRSDEFERFLGERSKELAERLEDAKDVFKRLKLRE